MSGATKSLPQLLQDLDTANLAVDSLRAERDRVQQREANAMRALNAVQEAIGEALHDLRKNAPSGSLWHVRMHLKGAE